MGEDGMGKLSEVLLVDDSDADNFLNRRVIVKSECAERISVAKNGKLALDYLTTPVDGVYPSPELIFLDLNMPVMDGWEFLNRYKELPEEHQAGVTVCMLSTSEQEEDRQAALRSGVVMEFLCKPLRQTAVRAVLNRFFPERFGEPAGAPGEAPRGPAGDR